MIEDFEQICGQAPEGTESLNFQASDPNFVFENDPLYQTVVLYDRDGNIVNVNSWKIVFVFHVCYQLFIWCETRS